MNNNFLKGIKSYVRVYSIENHNQYLCLVCTKTRFVPIWTVSRIESYVQRKTIVKNIITILLYLFNRLCNKTMVYFRILLFPVPRYIGDSPNRIKEKTLHGSPKNTFKHF